MQIPQNIPIEYRAHEDSLGNVDSLVQSNQGGPQNSHRGERGIQHSSQHSSSHQLSNSSSSNDFARGVELIEQLKQ